MWRLWKLSSRCRLCTTRHLKSRMNRFGNKGGICPLFCCFFMSCTTDSDDDEDDFRRPLMKAKRYKNKHLYRKTKPKEIKRRSLSESTSISPSPILHSGLKRLPFNGTLSDLTERSEEESVYGNITASTIVHGGQFSFQLSEPRFVLSEEEEDGYYGSNSKTHIGKSNETKTVG